MRWIRLLLIAVFLAPAAARAQGLGPIGVTLLRAVTTNLNGTGICVAQPEANDGTNNWEVNPGVEEQPISLFTYISAGGSTNVFPNSLSGESGHADDVAWYFYGVPGGVATNVAHVDSYDADYFANNIVAAMSPPPTNDAVVNQSYIFGYVTTNSPPLPMYYISVADQEMADSQFDNYAAQYPTLFVSAVGNGGAVDPPGTCYNGIGVGCYGGSSSTGPTLDNGRCKPELVAAVAGGETSWSTPYIAGAAAVMMQAGLRGDGGANTNAAADIRTVKALLINGAVKPPDWTNQAPSPLDYRYGAGVLDVFNSYEQLAGGQHDYVDSGWVQSGDPHPPTGATGTVSALSGWDFNSLASLSHPDYDAVNEYFFNVTNGVPADNFTAVVTLAWNRQLNQTNINNLGLFLYNCANSNLVACSTSLVDNVQHLYVPRLPQGRYDLQVWKSGGGNIVSPSETYALAWTFFSGSLAQAKSGTNVSLSWPVYPDGFVLESATNLAAPAVWSTNSPVPVVTNRQNVVVLGTTNRAQFFRLWWP